MINNKAYTFEHYYVFFKFSFEHINMFVSCLFVKTCISMRGCFIRFSKVSGKKSTSDIKGHFNSLRNILLKNVHISI